MITDEIKADFAAIRDNNYGNIALFSCKVNGIPTVAIVAVTEDDKNYSVVPMFVAVTKDMVLEAPDGQIAKKQ